MLLHMLSVNINQLMFSESYQPEKLKKTLYILQA